MDAQLQIRQNTMEAQEYAQDLLQWSQSMNQKSAGKQTSQQQSDQGAPSVRGRAPGSVQNAPVSMQQPALQPSKVLAARTNRPASHTYAHYSKWDKFDPDAEPDQPAAAKQHSRQVPAAINQPQLPRPRQPAAKPSTATQRPGAAAAASIASDAAALKDRGNKLFQAGYFDDAISCYTQSIAQQPTSLAYANRAMAQLKVGRPAEAEQDCSAALQLDASYIKALHRRGTARRQLGRLLEAAVDFEAALRLEPGNATVQADRDAVLEQHLQQQKVQASGGVWRSIPVTEQQHQHQHQHQQQQASQEQQAGSKAASELRPAASGDEAAGGSPPANGCGLNSSDTTVAAAAVAAMSSTAEAMAVRQQQPPVRSPSPQQASTAAAAAAAAAALAARRASSLKAPKTGNEFEAAWRSFRGDVQLQAKYLALVPVQQLPTIFKTSLTAPLLRDILTAALMAVKGSEAAAAASSGRIKDPCIKDAALRSSSEDLSVGHAVDLLQQLPTLPRFDMAAMCLTSRDKAALRELWDAAAVPCSPGLAGQLAAVRAKYRL